MPTLAIDQGTAGPPQASLPPSGGGRRDAAAQGHHPELFRFPLRIYWEDTDAGGVVFYANYLKFFERARTEWLRSLGHEQEQLRAQTGVVFVVTDTRVRYLRPARLDDVLAVTVRVEHAGRAQMTIAQQAWRQRPHGEELLAEGTIRIGCVDAGTFRPQRIPTAIADSLNDMPSSPTG